jgi:hypothetical protein
VRHQRLVLSVVLALSALACKKKEAAVLSSEQAYVELASEYEQLCPIQANKARDTAAH